MAVRAIDAIELQKRMCALCNQDYADEPCEPSDCIFIRALNETPTLTPPNEPLTLEVLAKSQLLQMLGEKVEVIRMGEMCQAEWATVRSFGDCKTDSGCLCCHELYGKTWIAYRRPPEGDA